VDIIDESHFLGAVTPVSEESMENPKILFLLEYAFLQSFLILVVDQIKVQFLGSNPANLIIEPG
jgi:hypothetical protein